MKTLERKASAKSLRSGKIAIDNSIPDLSNHPVVVRKLEEAREFLKKHPIPEEILRGRR